MPDHVRNRDLIVASLREELVGPSPQGEDLDCSIAVRFDDPKASYGPWREKGTGEEILQRDAPVKRYGVGVLYPLETPSDESVEDASLVTSTAEVGEEPLTVLSDAAEKDIDEVARRIERAEGWATEDDDFDLTTATSFRPSTMGVTFLAELPAESVLTVAVSGGRYQRLIVSVAGQERVWWRRVPVFGKLEFTAEELRASRRLIRKPLAGAEFENLDIRVEVLSRPRADGSALITVCFVNRTKNEARPVSEISLFQTHFVATVSSSQSDALIEPYPSSRLVREGEDEGTPADDEEASLALLYHEMQTFGIGHGCAADWRIADGQPRAHSISAECLPSFETPSTTPDIFRDDGSRVEVSMAKLAGLIAGDDGLSEVEEVISRYEAWTSDRRRDVEQLSEEHRDAAERHLDACDESARRMRDGVSLLRSDAVANRAFQLANHAVLLQQLRSKPAARAAEYDSRARRIRFSEPYEDPDPLAGNGSRGSWRPFQIGFFLMCLRSTADPETDDRQAVELLWFPTGGGKTEAYLGLSAFAIFLRRLTSRTDLGVTVLMRYTLRLLTAQQFQRAAGLICAMERLRRQNVAELGDGRFTIGIWVGGTSTPNRREDARASLGALIRQERNAENPFLLIRCPWCRAQLGPVSHPRGTPRAVPRVLGYVVQGATVVFECSDSECDFAAGLPVLVIDEDVYENPPSLVIGTVDKFAMLAWRPAARALFGLAPDGSRIASPPALIIQDELHLISGPLGSMVGLYETLIEELCIDRRNPAKPIQPKIVASTATIRRYEDQINALYARNRAQLFPPPGLSANDSFFARYAIDADGKPQPGRLYVGVHAPGLGSQQTAEVRTFSALLQAPFPFAAEERDPWWTLMLFFNSLRELGVALSLLQSDVGDYLKVVRNRTDAKIRHLNDIKELTSRLKSEDVPAAIAALEVACTSRGYPVDVCLASNIIEVGIDVPRLSLMTVVGQPKTTSQYIQVTGRVGRLWQERPGLVVTIYSPSKPRDRSHFEQFRSYHERLYAQVEPTSVTPFSPPALDRALHGVMAAYARQAGDERVAASPFPYPGNLIEDLRQVMVQRLRAVDPEEELNFERVFDGRADEWRKWQRTNWQGRWTDSDVPLLRQAGTYATAERARVSWSTPQSMRNVDAECQVEITRLYLDD